MSLISRYLSLTFFKNWSLALTAFIVLYTAIDFIEKVADFMGKGIDFSTTVLFFLAQLPKVIVLMSPVATLVGVMITLTILARNSEVVAFKACGVSLYRLSVPLLASALAVSLGTFLLSDVLAPKSNAVANAIWQGQVKGRLNTSTVVEDIWLKGIKQLQHLGSYDEADGTVKEVTLIFTDDEMNLARRIDAQGGRFTENNLVLYNVKEKIYADEPGSDDRYVVYKTHPIQVISDWPSPPPGFGRVDQNSEELSVAELWRAIDRLSAEGFGPVRQRVDLHFKFSFALLPVIMVVVGLPIGFWREKGGSVALGLASGLLLSFIYLITMELARSLGYSGLLPALIAAWLPNLIFLLFGTYLFSYVRQ